MSDQSPNRGVMIVLAYLWLLALIPLLLERDDPEVQWHAKHGLVLMIAEVIAIFLFVTLVGVVALTKFGIGCALGVLLVFGWVAILGTHIVAILKGINGSRLTIPWISDYANTF